MQPKETERELRDYARKDQDFSLLQGYINILLAFMFARVGGRQRERRTIVLRDSISSLFSLHDTGVTVTKPH